MAGPTKVQLPPEVRFATAQVPVAQLIRRLRDFVSRGETERRVESLAKLVEEHDGLFIASPEYNAGYPPALKNAISMPLKLSFVSSSIL